MKSPISEEAVDLGHVLVALRRAAGWSREEAAKNAWVVKSEIAQWEHGFRKPGVRMFNQLTRAYGLHPREVELLRELFTVARQRRAGTRAFERPDHQDAPPEHVVRAAALLRQVLETLNAGPDGEEAGSKAEPGSQGGKTSPAS